MSRGKASGYALGAKHIPTILGMVARGDRDHDIAAWFGVNQGRIAEAKDGKWGNPAMLAANMLPPSGPPGIKGQRLRQAAKSVESLLVAGNHAEALVKLQNAFKDYDRNEA
jgi:hypothetical protein